MWVDGAVGVVVCGNGEHWWSAVVVVVMLVVGRGVVAPRIVLTP